MFHTRIICLIAVLAAIGPASAADAKTRQYSADITSSALSTAGGYPAVGGSAYLVGEMRSGALGSGAVLDHITVTGQPFGAPIFTFEGTEVDATPKGMLMSELTGYTVARDDGGLDVFIDGHFIGGTGRYRDATGHYRFKGTIPEGSTEATGHSRGRVVF